MSMSTIYESGSCQPCAECMHGCHHWIEASINPDEDFAIEEFLAWHPQFGTPEEVNDSLTNELMQSHYECKHCPAVVARRTP